MIPLAAVTAVVAGIGTLAVRKLCPLPLAGRLALIAIGVVSAANVLAHFGLTGLAKDGQALILLIVCAGLVYKHRMEAYTVTFACVLGWFVIAYHAEFERLIEGQAFTLIMGFALFLIAFEGRRKSYESMFELQEELQHAALTDRLTQLPNRACALSRLTAALAQARRRSDFHFALCFLDVNNFKPINDRFGHASGDKALQAIAAQLRSNCRANDFVARLGGDEFLVLLDDISDMRVMEQVVERLRRSLDLVVEVNAASPIVVNVSAGAVWSGRGFSSAEKMLEAADAAMYNVKKRSKTSVFAWPAFRGIRAATGRSPLASA